MFHLAIHSLSSLKELLEDRFEVQGITVGKNGGGLFSNKVKSALDDADWVIVNFIETSNRPSKKYGVNTEVIKSLSGLVDDKKWSINLLLIHIDWMKNSKRCQIKFLV